ncbi:MAG: hypothetical protein Q4F11_03950 [Eubacteriales bacterium]|nr:hypothetical protein [Eubacteriales bacterium]
MNGYLFRYIMKSIVRRRREIIRVIVATFVAVFFVTGVLTFESNMYYWQMASNKERFGSWFVMEPGNDKVNEGLVNNPYLNSPVTSTNICNIMDEDFEVTKYKMGFFTEDFLNQGHITLLEGRMPESDSEIAGDMNTLLKLGYSINVGDTITVRFLDKNNNNEEKTKDYTLVGILRSYSNIWAAGDILPGIIVSEQGMQSLNMKMNTVYAYSIKNYVKTSDYRGIYENNLKKLANGKLYYNDDVYDFKPWGSKAIYNYMYLLVVVIGVVTISYQLIGYHNS